MVFNSAQKFGEAMAAVRSNQHTTRLFRWAGENASEFTNNKLEVLRNFDELPQVLSSLSTDNFLRHVVEFAFGQPSVKTRLVWDAVADEIVNRDAVSLGTEGIGRSLSAFSKVNYSNGNVLNDLRDKSLKVWDNATLQDFGVFLKSFTKLKYHPGHQFLDAVAHSVLHEKGACDVQAACDILHAYSDYRPHDKDVFSQLASMLAPNVSHFNSKDFSTVLSVFARVKVKDTKLLNSVTKSLPTTLGNFEPMELGSVCHGLALLNIRDAALSATVSVHVQGKVHKMSAPTLALVANAFAKFAKGNDGIVDKSLFIALRKRAERVLHEFPQDPRELSTVVHYLTEAGQATEHFANMALRSLLERADSTSRPQTVAQVLRTLVKLKSLSVDVNPCARAFCARAVQLSDRLTLIDVGEIGLSVSSLAIPDCKKSITPVLLQALTKTSTLSTSALRSKDLAAAVLACASLTSETKLSKGSKSAWKIVADICTKTAVLSPGETATVLKSFRMISKEVEPEIIVKVFSALLPTLVNFAEKNKLALPDLAIAVHAIPCYEPLCQDRVTLEAIKSRLCDVATARLKDFSTRDAALVLSAVASGGDEHIRLLLERKDWQPTQLRLLGKGLLSSEHSSVKTAAFTSKVSAFLQEAKSLDKLTGILVSQVALLNSRSIFLEPVLPALPHARLLVELVKKNLSSEGKYHHEVDLICLTALSDCGLRDRNTILVLIQRIAGSSLSPEDCLRLLSAMGHLSISPQEVINLPLAQEGRTLTTTKWNKFLQLACQAAKTTGNIRFLFGLLSVLGDLPRAPENVSLLQARFLLGNSEIVLPLNQLEQVTGSTKDDAESVRKSVLDVLNVVVKASPLLSDRTDTIQVLQ